MSETPTEPTAAVVPADAPLTPDAVLPPGVKPTPNYLAAIELGHVLAKSGLYTDVRDPAKAAVKVMIGLDLGVSPTAAMQGIQTFEEKGKTVFLIEGKLLAAVVKARPDVDYKFIERTDERVEIEFLRDGEKQEPNMVWTVERAKREVPKFDRKTETWGTMPMVMLTWRALAEGIRIHFPDVIAGQPIYVEEEIEPPESSGIREALEPPKAEPLTDKRADEQRQAARGIFDELKESNPDRLLVPVYAGMIARAEHSHERLDDEIARLTDLRDTEAELQGLYAEIKDTLDKADAKAAIDRCEREPSNRERIKAARDYLPIEGEVVKEGEDK